MKAMHVAWGQAVHVVDDWTQFAGGQSGGHEGVSLGQTTQRLKMVRMTWSTLGEPWLAKAAMGTAVRWAAAVDEGRAAGAKGQEEATRDAKRADGAWQSDQRQDKKRRERW